MNSVENGADTPQGAGNEADTDTDDLDALLDSYKSEERQKGDQKPEEKQGGKPDIDALLKEVRELRERQESFEKEARLGENRKDLSESVKAIKKAEPGLAKLKDQRVEDMLVGQGLRDPRIEEAFARRRIDKKGWDKVLKGLAKDFAGDFDDEDKGEDIDAVTAASRGVSTRRSDDDFAKKVSQMTPGDFKKFEEELAAKR